MGPSLVTIVFAILSFIVTFTVALALARWWKKKHERKDRKDEAEAAKGLSRQVRRARQRKDAGR